MLQIWPQQSLASTLWATVGCTHTPSQDGVKPPATHTCPKNEWQCNSQHNSTGKLRQHQLDMVCKTSDSYLNHPLSLAPIGLKCSMKKISKAVCCNYTSVSENNGAMKSWRQTTIATVGNHNKTMLQFLPFAVQPVSPTAHASVCPTLPSSQGPPEQDSTTLLVYRRQLYSLFGLVWHWGTCGVILCKAAAEKNRVHNQNDH